MALSQGNPQHAALAREVAALRALVVRLDSATAQLQRALVAGLAMTLTPTSLRCKLIAMTDAEVLLADVQALRRKARRDRRASAFPLFLFGGLILLAPICYLPDRIPIEFLEQYLTYTYYPGPFPLFSGLFGHLRYPGLVGWYWLLTIVLGFVATAWWYRRRAMRVGVDFCSVCPF
jgi:hypothetical protein